MQAEIPEARTPEIQSRNRNGRTGEPPKHEGKPTGSKVHRLSQGGQFYIQPENPERKKMPLLTVDQYLRKAKQDKSVSDLIRSLHKTTIMSFAEWERQTAALLKKKTW